MSLIRVTDPRWYTDAMLLIALLVLLAMWWAGP